MAQTEHQKAITTTYGKALTELRRRHDEEFHEILDEFYATAGVEVRRRLTGERKRQADIAKARATLAALEGNAE